MKYEEIRIGMKVKDTWFTDGYVNHKAVSVSGWGLGKVIRKLKTAIHIEFSIKGLVIFDIPHLQFLEKA